MEKEQLLVKQKLVYVSPAIRIFVVEMEQGIAAGSVVVESTNSSSEVLEEWDNGTDRETNSNW